MHPVHCDGHSNFQLARCVGRFASGAYAHDGVLRQCDDAKVLEHKGGQVRVGMEQDGIVRSGVGKVNGEHPCRLVPIAS